MIVAVHQSVETEREWEECREVLEFLGYTVVRNGTPFIPEPMYLIDPRVPEYRGIKNAVEQIKLNHPHSIMQEWHRSKNGLDKTCKVVYNDDDPTCYT